MKLTCCAVVFAIVASAAPAKKEKKAELRQQAASAPAVLWRDPGNIAEENLVYGPGGEKHAPHSTYTFVSEDLNGTQPKYVIKDENGTKWKMKIGQEAKPENVADRIVWAVGYYTNEDYFLPEIHIDGLPTHLHRGQKARLAGGLFKDARLKRYLKNDEKIETWKWKENPFYGTREFNGLRVMMALIDNWDLKDVNNAVYFDEKGKQGLTPERIYLVSDLGGSFGTTGLRLNRRVSKGDLRAYEHAPFITYSTNEFVDFSTPSAPSFPYLLFSPRNFFERVHFEWIGRRVPVQDARWVGRLLGQLRTEQIEDAFRASGYDPERVEGFTKALQKRIAALNQL